MKKHFHKIILSIIILITLSACSDPIFYTIMNEPRKLDPLINGSPTNFVTAGDFIYVATGSNLFKFHNVAGDNYWLGANRPGGFIMQLAVAGSYLFALSDNGIVKYADHTSSSLFWNNLSGVDDVRSIYAIGNNLYIHARHDGVHKIIHVNAVNAGLAQTPLFEFNRNSEFIGAAGNSSGYYLCTKNGYYYSTSASSFSTNNFSTLTNDYYMGIIQLATSNVVVAITREGKIHSLTQDQHVGGSVASFSDSRLATGALAVWIDGADHLLLAGRQDIGYSTNTGYTYGYVEIEFNSSGVFQETTFRIPGLDVSEGKPSTVSSQNLYLSSIGKNPVNHIIQPKSTGNTLIFASTQKSGVWSYRERHGKWQWNAEE